MSFDNEPLKIIGVVLAGILVIVWIGVVVCTVRAIWMRQLLWPADVEETK